MIINQLAEDEREIKRLYLENDSMRVDGERVTKILAYQESGEIGLVTWFAIYKGDVITSRVNAKYVVEVAYTL